MENGNKQNNKWKKPLFLDKRKETKQIKNEFVGDKNKTTNGNKTTQQVFFCLKSWTFFFIFYFYFLFETFLSLLLFQPWWPLATFFLYYFSLCIPFLSAFLFSLCFFSLCVSFLSVLLFSLYLFALCFYLYKSSFIDFSHMRLIYLFILYCCYYFVSEFFSFPGSILSFFKFIFSSPFFSFLSAGTPW